MVAARVNIFGGMIPLMDDRLLPDTAAARSVNTWLYSGALLGLPQLSHLYTPSIPEIGKVYRLPESYERAAYLPASTYMEFPNPNTDVIRAPVFGDVWDRYYWVVPGTRPRYDSRARIEAGSVGYLLGIPSPSTPPGVTATGGVDTADYTRAYLTTWVSVYGEEGPPSPPTVVDGKSDATWTITLPVAASEDLGNDRDLRKVRIYRTITSTFGAATFFLVDELDIDQTTGEALPSGTYIDAITDQDVSANAQLQTFAWTAPPTLDGWVMMPNGIVAAFRDNELWFSEPYRPHAWPVEFVQTVEFPIVGLGITGQTLVVCTRGSPVIATGSTPESITTSKLTIYEPCLSRGSILSAPEGVYYASPNGLVLVGGGQAQNITKGLISRDRWLEFTGATVLRCARLGTAYYGFGSVVVGIWNPDAFSDHAFAQSDASGAKRGVLIDAFDQRVAFSLLASEDAAYGVQNDDWSGQVFVLSRTEARYINQDDLNVPRQMAIWWSKIFEAPFPNNFGVIQIKFQPAPWIVQNPIRNTDFDQVLGPDQYGLLRVYADGRHVSTRELRKSGEIFKLPSGFKADSWQFELNTYARITSATIAGSAKELRSV